MNNILIAPILLLVVGSASSVSVYGCSTQEVSKETTAIHKRTALHELAETGEVKRLAELLRASLEIDARDEFGETPLLTAVRFNKREAAALLIASGADVNAKDNKGVTPLMMAVLGINLPLIQDLIVAGADVNARDRNGYTVLMHGAAFATDESRKVLRALASYGANVNAAIEDGTTALTFSVRNSSVETVSCLLSLGADPNAKDKKGLTALDYASEISRKYPTKAAREIERQMRQALISAGAVQ